MAKIFLRKKITERISEGHPWVFENEIGDEEGTYAPGDIVSVFSSNGSFVGKGYINPASVIRIRFLSRKEEAIDAAFFRTCIARARDLRQRAGLVENMRLVSGEADFLPGLVIDRFGRYLVLQMLTLGMSRQKPVIVEVLRELFPGCIIYERSDAAVRLLEGLKPETGFLAGSGETVIPFYHDGLILDTDIARGPRTGLYWEQLWISRSLKPFVGGANVLDTFCYAGCCGLHAALYGANSVTGIELDEASWKLSLRNAERNGFAGRCSFEKGNAFDLLKRYVREDARFDVIVLDPPPLVKHKEKIPAALGAYKELHLRAMKLLVRGGRLFTTSSTHLIGEEMMISVFRAAARDCGRSWRIIGKISQPPDHPVLWNLPATESFRGFILQID